jgi:two-component system phosphate regulon sensor histidine kinase PhoR
MKISQLQKQSLKIAFFGTSIIFITGGIIHFNWEVDSIILGLYFCIAFFVLFLVSSHFIQKYINRQISRIYKSRLFDNEPFLKNEVTDLDFELLIKKISQFAENKRLEIEKLHNRDDFRKDFLGDVSHELKTPLFSAQGYIYTILDKSFDDDVLRQKYLERTRKSIERLTYIVKDLDMIAKLESGMKLEHATFDIVKVIRDVIEIMEIKSSKKDIKLEFAEPYDFPILVKADKDKVEQVIFNLISNSIKYGKTGGFTRIKISTHSIYQIIVEVKDNGVGIAKEHIPRLFERFYRVEKSRSRDQGGSGLGLSIVKHILEAHKQEVFIESELGKGSLFSFTLNKTEA